MAEGVIAGGKNFSGALVNQQQALLLETRAATGTGPTIDTSKIKNGSVVTKGTFVATILIEQSNDGTNFETIATITAPGIVAIDTYAKNIRGRVSAYTSGTIDSVDYAGIA